MLVLTNRRFSKVGISLEAQDILAIPVAFVGCLRSMTAVQCTTPYNLQVCAIMCWCSGSSGERGLVFKGFLRHKKGFI